MSTLNRYPVWKNLLILLVVTLGLVYSIPNLYPDDEAVQITHESQAMTAADLDAVEDALAAAGIDSFGPELSEDSLLLRFAGVGEQLRAKTAIEDALPDGYIVALNLAPTTPDWLRAIGAGKMNLGLDLQGGVHFLMEVDMDEALERRMEDNASNIRAILRDMRIRTRGINLMDETRLEIRFTSGDDRARARSELEDAFPELQFQNGGVGEVFVLDMILTPDVILQIQRDTLQANRITLLNRVDALGVAEPNVQQQGSDRIAVELPGVQDPAQAIRILQRIATLEFHLEAASGAPRRTYQTYPHPSSPGAVVRVDNDVILQGDRISRVRSSLDQYGLPQVEISLDAQGGAQINRITRDNVNRMMDILLIETRSRTVVRLNDRGEEVEETEFYEEKRLISHANIQEPLGREFRITGLTQREALDLSLLISSGSLAAPMTIVEQSVIGPTMGQENLRAGILGVQVAAVLVVLFMLFYYRLFGIAANVALIMNILLIFAVMSSILPATLTLPGIVGIVLTVGMAVDANVLIFTRIREELAAGMPPQQAISAGYDRAFTTIFDANLTTFLVAVVLFTIGTGPVKGFAVTLMIGIVTSLFTAIIGTRALINLFYGGRKVKRLSIGSYHPPKILQRGIDFMSVRVIAGAVSAVLVLGAAGSLALKGLEFGLDFTSGTSVRLNFSEPADPGEVSRILADNGYEDVVVVNFGSDRDIRIVLPIDESVAEAGQAEQAAEVGQVISGLLNEAGGAQVTLLGSDYVSAKVGAELAEQGGLGMLVALGIIMVYIAVRFQFKFSVGAVVALAHDLLITLGIFSVTGMEFNLNTLAAMLAIIGYSLNDTIVVSDRIRENFRRMRKGTPEEMINTSLNQTLGRTLITSFTTLLVLFSILFIGGDVTAGFAVALIIGVVVGTYSSIYIASNVILYMNVSREDLMLPEKPDPEAAGGVV